MDANRVVPAEGRRRAPAKAGNDASVRQHSRVYACAHGLETHAHATIPCAHIHKYISCIINLMHTHHTSHANTQIQNDTQMHARIRTRTHTHAYARMQRKNEDGPYPSPVPQGIKHAHSREGAALLLTTLPKWPS